MCFCVRLNLSGPCSLSLLNSPLVVGTLELEAPFAFTLTLSLRLLSCQRLQRNPLLGYTLPRLRFDFPSLICQRRPRVCYDPGGFCRSGFCSCLGVLRDLLRCRHTFLS